MAAMSFKYACQMRDPVFLRSVEQGLTVSMGNVRQIFAFFPSVFNLKPPLLLQAYLHF